MKKLFLLVLVVIMVGALLPQSRSVEAAPTAPVDKATKACLNKIVYYNLTDSSGTILYIRYWQRAYWCYNGVVVQSYTVSRGRFDYSSYWNLYQLHPIVASGNTTNYIGFLSSAIFRGGGIDWWHPYIFQRVSAAGGYSYTGWSYSW